MCHKFENDLCDVVKVLQKAIAMYLKIMRLKFHTMENQIEVMHEYFYTFSYPEKSTVVLIQISVHTKCNKMLWCL
jgi:hypothetical protein